MAVEFTDANFDQEVLKSDLPVVVDCWAAWCAPCRMIAPTIEALAEEYKGKVKIGKLDVDSNMNTAMKYQIKSIPTLLFFKGGRVVNSMVGALPKETLVKHIENL
ncbi:MAG: thioredoxin [bacterium]|nr:thioredoxin [bacterium]